MGSSLQPGTTTQESGPRHSGPATRAAGEGTSSETRGSGGVLNQEGVSPGRTASRISTREDCGAMPTRFLPITTVRRNTLEDEPGVRPTGHCRLAYIAAELSRNATR